MRNLIPFIGWLIQKSFQGLFNLHRSYQRYMNYEPWAGVFLGAVFSAISFLIAMLIMVFAFDIQHPSGLLALACILPQITYIVYTGFSVLYNNFEAERAEIFEILRQRN
jgi:hypothetical protein